MGYPIFSALAHSIPIRARWEAAAFGALWLLLTRGSMATLSPVLHHSDSTCLGLSHRQTPQTRLAPPKPPQPLVQLIDVAPLSARLVGGMCTTAWEFPAF